MNFREQPNNCEIAKFIQVRLSNNWASVIMLPDSTIIISNEMFTVCLLIKGDNIEYIMSYVSQKIW